MITELYFSCDDNKPSYVRSFATSQFAASASNLRNSLGIVGYLLEPGSDFRGKASDRSTGRLIGKRNAQLQFELAMIDGERGLIDSCAISGAGQSRRQLASRTNSGNKANNR